MSEHTPLTDKCWCGGDVGPRTPGDSNGLGCLEDLTHRWGGARPRSAAPWPACATYPNLGCVCRGSLMPPCKATCTRKRIGDLTPLPIAPTETGSTSRLCGADVMQDGAWTGAWCCLPYGHDGDCE